MQEVFESIKEKCQKDSRIGRSSLTAFLEIIDGAAKEYNKENNWQKDVIEYGVTGCLNENYRRGYEAGRKNKGWILTSKRLPNFEERKKSYCRNQHGAQFIVMIEGATQPTTLYIKMNEDIWFDEQKELYKVIAWQPLPEAYKMATT